MRSEHRQEQIARARDCERPGHGLGGRKERRTLAACRLRFRSVHYVGQEPELSAKSFKLRRAVILLPSNQVPVIEEMLPAIENAIAELGDKRFVEL